MNAEAPLAAAPTATTALQTVGGLLLVIAAIFALAWLLRRVQALRPATAGLLRVHGGLQVGARERVLLVQAGETHLLIGVAPGRVQTLHVFDTAPQGQEAAGASAGSAAAANFPELLQRALGRGRRP